jgi:hypothetical protein
MTNPIALIGSVTGWKQGFRVPLNSTGYDTGSRQEIKIPLTV